MPVLPSLIANDKLVHGILYAVMGVLLGWGSWASGMRRAWPALVVGYAYGAVDEWHQFFVPNRIPSFSDWVADVVGVTVGFFAILVVLRARTPVRDRVGEAAGE